MIPQYTKRATCNECLSPLYNEEEDVCPSCGHVGSLKRVCRIVAKQRKSTLMATFGVLWGHVVVTHVDDTKITDTVIDDILNECS